jgi:hypothetical protein
MHMDERGSMQRRILIGGLMAAATLGVGRALYAQAPAPPTPPPFTSEQLDQMLAPIALYPDALLSQVLMAATYPLEVVEAARWSQANPALKGDAAVSAAAGQGWDVSVQSLVAFPQVLSMMNDHLDWTQNLGNAMLAQQQDVSDSIQRLRDRAAAAGSLNNSSQLKVDYLGSGPDQMIQIDPVDPAMYYVPYYNPVWAYGSWPYAAYPPFYWPPAPRFGYGAILATGFMFGAGLAVSAAIFGGWHWARGGSFMNINVDRALRLDPHFDRARINNGVWAHDPEHRRGVAYRDATTRERFGQGGPGVGQRRDFRGRVESPPGGEPRGRPEANARPNGPAPHPEAARPEVAHPQVARPEAPRPEASRTPTPQVRGAPRPQAASRPYVPQRGGAINGVNHGAQVNREAARGNAAIQHAASHPAPAPHPAPQARGGRK